MRILVLGGTRFLGRALVDAALTRGHELTLFNRGRSNPHLYPEVERLVGDRAGELVALRGRTWDAVIDTCGYVPHVVAASLEALSSSGLYCFVSSISVYADFGVPVDESSDLAELGDLPDDEVTDESYGALKALCERAVTAAFGNRSIVVRPGLITGPHDPTGRSRTGRTASPAEVRSSLPRRPRSSCSRSTCATSERGSSRPARQR